MRGRRDAFRKLSQSIKKKKNTASAENRVRVLPLIFSVAGFLGVMYFKEITNSPLYWAKAEAGRAEAACWRKVHHSQETQQTQTTIQHFNPSGPYRMLISLTINIYTHILLYVTKVHMNLNIRLHLMHPLKSRQFRQNQVWWQKCQLFYSFQWE